MNPSMKPENGIVTATLLIRVVAARTVGYNVQLRHKDLLKNRLDVQVDP